MHWIAALFTTIFLLVSALPAQAQETSRMGMHILGTQELSEAKAFLAESNADQWHYLTVPFTLQDLERKQEWQAFFDEARAQKVIPLVRLATQVEDDSWIVPNRKQIVDQLDFLSSLHWPTDRKHIIIFNEVNHAKEWGGTINPEEYAQYFRFAALWAKSEQSNFVVLPAAMDLAAPTGPTTREAFSYLEAMRAADHDIFTLADVWNSHSYPNPGFSSSPYKTGKNSLRGFEYELAYLKEHTGRDYQVFITETGWEVNNATRRWLTSYYTYAVQHIWSHPQVVAVTPFIYRGAPGPFAGFSFIDAAGKPTVQYYALQRAMQNVAGAQTKSPTR